MRILFLHGWQSVVGGVKPTCLATHGHNVLNPKLPDEDFAEAVRIAQAEFDRYRPDVVVGSSRGAAVAMNINIGEAKRVLLCPAWKNWGAVKSVAANTVILHSRLDDVIPFADSEELIRNSQLPLALLIDVGRDHRLADTESLERMLQACEGKVPLLDVTVYYLEMLAPMRRAVAAPCENLSVEFVRLPTVAFYRSLYNAVGKDYYWLSRRKMSDEALAALLGDARNELHVLHVA